MQFSIIIPTYNEATHIQRLILHLQRIAAGYTYEIIVCDGGSSDSTIEIAAAAGAKTIASPVKGRAGQMNYASHQACGAILYFVHADCLPPESCFSAIHKRISNGFEAGCFRYKFDSNRWYLKFNAFFTRFSGMICRGGDQTLFIKKATFEQIKGFNERFIIMEDYDLVRRLRRGHHTFQIIPEYAIVSARKYDKNSWLKVNFANTVAMLMFISGAASPQRIKATYHGLIKHPKDE
jgi:rSAM/selenodomain-associated transferase 2